MKALEQFREDIVFDAVLRGHRLVFHSTWGLFSPRTIDDGSRLLIEHIDLQDGQDTFDLGCGYGAIGVSIAKACPGGQVHMVDTNFVAVDFARKNAELNGLANCNAYLSNAFSAAGNGKYDNIVSNLPAKVGKELLCIILSDAKARLRPGGQLVVVTISGLKEFIKWNFKDTFGNYEKIKQGKDYTVARAVKEGRKRDELPNQRLQDTRNQPKEANTPNDSGLEMI